MKYNYPVLFLLTLCAITTKSLFAQTPRVVPFISHGGRVDWGKAGIAYDFLDTATGYYEMGLIQPDGSGFVNLTKGVVNIPQKHNGNPACYYPNGRYIIYEAEKDSNYNAADEFYGSSANSTPGIGLNCDLWVVDLQTSTFSRLTDLPTKRTRNDTTPTSGILHPQFSHNGNKVLWSQCINIADTSRGTALPGLWELNISDFDTTGGTPHLTNTTHYTSGGVLGDFTFLETSGGFSPNDSTVIYCANAMPGQLAGYMDIYAFNFYTNQVVDLTPDTNVWDEHSHYTYDGSSILWMNSTGYTFIDDVTQVPKTDYWMMNKDGSHKRQVTFFNNPDSAEHVYANGGLVASSDDAWSPFGGDTAVCYVQIFGQETSREIFYLIGAQQKDTVIDTTTTAITPINKEANGFSFYPNPASDKIAVDLRGFASEPVELKLYAVSGELLYTGQANNLQQPYIVQTNLLAKGVYIVEAVSDSQALNKRLIIQ